MEPLNDLTYLLNVLSYLSIFFSLHFSWMCMGKLTGSCPQSPILQLCEFRVYFVKFLILIIFLISKISTSFSFLSAFCFISVFFPICHFILWISFLSLCSESPKYFKYFFELFYILTSQYDLYPNYSFYWPTFLLIITSMCFGILFSFFFIGRFIFLSSLSASLKSSAVIPPDLQGPESRNLLSIYDSGMTLAQVLVARKYLLPLLPLIK